MAAALKPGDPVIHIVTRVHWKVVDYDPELQLATCVHSGPRRFVVRTIHADELDPVSDLKNAGRV